MFIGRHIALFVIVTFAFSAMANAQQAAPPPSAEGAERPLRIIVLNLDQIRRDAVVVKNIRDQIAEFRKGFQAGIQKEEDALRSANQELAKKRTILSPEAFAKERRLFEQRVVGVQKLVQKRKRQLDQAQVDAMLQVEGHLNKVISDIAQGRRASIVLRRSQTILVARDIDITAEVLGRLNKELVQIPVKKPND